MIVLKRVLTRKSILGFGYKEDRDLSVQMLLDLGKKTLLRDAYYGLDKIDFTDDILNELEITEQYRISKPGKDRLMRAKFYDDLITKEKAKRTEIDNIKSASRKMKVKKAICTSKLKAMNFLNKKDYLRSKNQN